MLSSARLEALAAVCDTGSFDQAAQRLHVTPSALSQRVTALEREVGQVLVRRSRPVAPTAAGRVMLGLARQTMLLHADALDQISTVSEPLGSRDLVVSLAINADSISTWFQSVIAEIAQDRGFLLDLHVEDQDHTAQLLAEGRVMAAVTTSCDPAPGCSVELLGEMKYWTVCSPGLLPEDDLDSIDLSKLPMMRFDVKDGLQHSMLRQLGVTSEPPTHFIPSNREFLDAIRLGLGWGVVPRAQVEADIVSGELVRLFPSHVVNVALYWQRWRIESLLLEALSEGARRAARENL